MSVAATLKQKLSAFFASDEIKPLLEEDKEYSVIERPKVLADGEPEDEPADPKGGLPEGDDDTAAADAAPVTDPANPEGDQAPAADTSIEARFATLSTRLAETEATAFVDAEISAGRMMPAQKESVHALFVQAVKDDISSPLVQSSRVEQLKASQAAVKPNGLMHEKVDTSANELFVLTANSSKSKLDREIDAQVDSYVATVSPGQKKPEAVN